MSRFSAAVTRIFGSTSTAALNASASADDKGEAVTITRAEADILEADYKADIEDARVAGVEQGRKEANARFNTVLDSDAGKANPTAARTLLANEKLTAEEIVTMLPNLGAAAPAADAGNAGERTTHLDQTKPLNLQPQNDDDENASAQGGKEAAAGSGTTTWASVQGKSPLAEGGVRAAQAK